MPFGWSRSRGNCRRQRCPLGAFSQSPRCGVFVPRRPVSVLPRGQQPGAALRSLEVQGDVLERDGPYRLSGHWWEQNVSWARTEWDVQLAGGAVCRCHEEAGTWKLDGIYDSEAHRCRTSNFTPAVRLAFSGAARPRSR